MNTEPTILIVPGLRDHVPQHWQTLLAAELPRVRTVPPLTTDKLSCAARVDAIERELAAIDGPVIVVAHSAGCMMLVHWAARGGRRPIHGALLACPADVETPMPDGYPSIDALREHGWLPVPRTPLPFRAIAAASTNDPLARFLRIATMAHDWGARLANLGAVGHLNPASGHGPWPLAHELIRELA